MTVVVTVSGASAASAKCNPNRSNNGVSYADGWYRSGVQGGVYSDIYNYYPPLRATW